MERESWRAPTFRVAAPPPELESMENVPERRRKGPVADSRKTLGEGGDLGSTLGDRGDLGSVS